jgi:membrane protein DedA with SNARE-associated domain
VRRLVEAIVQAVLGLHGVAAYLLLGTMVFAETAAFLGLVSPGEVAMLLGGVLAQRGRVSLQVMIAVAAGAAVLGDSAGYWLGRRWGSLLFDRPTLRRRFASQIDRTRGYFRKEGRRAVLVGRWLSVVRSLIPAVAGEAGMPYGRFLAYSLPGAAIWAASFVLLGYAAGASWRLVERLVGPASLIVLLLVAVAVSIRWSARRIADRPDRVLDILERLSRTRMVRWGLERYGAELRWLARRFDPSIAPGLGLTSLLALLGLAAWAAGEIIDGLFSRQHLALIDTPVLRWFAEHRTDPISAVANAISGATGAPWGLAALAAGLVMLALVYGRAGAARSTLGVAGAVGVSFLLGRFLHASVSGISFPSTRLAAIAALTVHVAVLAGPRHGWRVSVRLAAVGAFLASIVALALLVLTQSTLSGLAAGAALGIAWAALLEAQARLPAWRADSQKAPAT